MTVTEAEPGIAELLEMAGARPPKHGRGKWTCPECHCDTLSVNRENQVFKCHHAGCDFHGGIGTLRKRLGIEREWLPRDEYLRQMRERERAEEAARRLYAAAHKRQLELREEFRNLALMELSAHECGPIEEAWDVLAEVCAERPRIEQKLDMLESRSTSQVFNALHNELGL